MNRYTNFIPLYQLGTKSTGKLLKLLIKMVGTTGFEPATTTPPVSCRFYSKVLIFISFSYFLSKSFYTGFNLFGVVSNSKLTPTKRLSCARSRPIWRTNESYP